MAGANVGTYSSTFSDNHTNINIKNTVQFIFCTWKYGIAAGDTNKRLSTSDEHDTAANGHAWLWDAHDARTCTGNPTPTIVITH